MIFEPGKTLSASVRWKNRGVQNYAPQMRLHLRNSDWAATWIEGPWVDSPVAEPGQDVIARVSQVIPIGWNNKMVDVRVEARGGGTKILSHRDRLFQCLEASAKWPGDRSDYTRWANAAQTTIIAKRTPQFRGPGGRYWIGFGMFPVYFEFIGDNLQWRTPDPNDPKFSPYVWLGVYIDVPDTPSWQNVAGVPDIAFPPEMWQVPPEYEPDMYALLWVMQKEAPSVRLVVDRDPPGLRESDFGAGAFSWDLVNLLLKEV